MCKGFLPKALIVLQDAKTKLQEIWGSENTLHEIREITMKISHDKYLISSIKIARERKKIENKSIIQTELETYQPIAIYLKSKFKQSNFKKNDRKI